MSCPIYIDGEMVCPDCGSSNLVSACPDGDEYERAMDECEDCGWSCCGGCI